MPYVILLFNHYADVFQYFLMLRSLGNGVYNLGNSPEQYQVYCHMTEIPGCGNGGWTLVMKIDGTKVS